MEPTKNDMEVPIGMDTCTQAALNYILPEFVENISMNNREGCERLIALQQGLIEVLFQQSKDTRMYGSAEEFHQDLKIYMGFTGYQEKFFYNLGERPIESPFEPYKSLKGKSYLFTKDIFHHMQRIIFMNNRTGNYCKVSKFFAATMLKALRNKQATMANELELVECSPEKIEKFMIDEVLEKDSSPLLKINLDNLHDNYDFTKDEVNILMRLNQEEYERSTKLNMGEPSSVEISTDCFRWLDHLHVALKNKHEWFNPTTGPNFVPAVRLFNDNGRKFVMITEWMEQMKRAGIDLHIMNLPESFFSSDEIATIDLKDIFGLVGTESMSKIEFVVTPIRRAKHAAVPIPTRRGGFCIPGSDALLELLKKLIHGKKLFQRTDRESWPKVESFMNKVTAYFNGEDISYFFIDLKKLDQIKGECDDEFLKLGLPNATTYIQDVNRGYFEILEELKNLNLARAFPNILNFVVLTYEKIQTSKYVGCEQTSDMYDAVEYCQMACIFQRFPKLKEFLHSQRSCNRIINSDCSECDVPCSMKITKWETIDGDIQIRQLIDDIKETNFQVYPLCIVSNKYRVYPSKSLLKDMLFLNNVLSKEALAKHKEVVSKSANLYDLPFVLIDKSDREWYHRVMLKELVDKKETISFNECMDRMMKRERNKIFLRTMWKWDARSRECVGVFKDEVFYLLHFVLKQQKLYNQENATKVRKLFTEKRNPYHGIVMEILSLRELKELLEMFNINKEIFVLIPDYHFVVPFSPIVQEYEAAYGYAYEMPQAIWFLFQLFGAYCDWEDILGRKTDEWNDLKTLYLYIFQSITRWWSIKNSYITVPPLLTMVDDVKKTCEKLKVTTFDQCKINDGKKQALINFRFFLNHPVVKLGNVFSERDKDKLRNTKVQRWRIYMAIMLLAIESQPEDEYPELKQHYLSCLRADHSEYLTPSSDIVDAVVHGGPCLISENSEEEFKRAKNKNQLEATVGNVFRVALNHVRHQETTPIGKKSKSVRWKSPLTQEAQNIFIERSSKEVEIEQQNNMHTDQSSSQSSNKRKKEETSEDSLPNVPMVEALTSSTLKNDNKEKTKKEQKSVGRKQDGVRMEVDRVEKCSKCYNAHLECTKAKETFNSERKKCTLLEKKLDAVQKELNSFKKREAEMEEMMKKKYDDQLNEMNRKLSECTEEKDTATAKIDELEEKLKWRTVEVNRKVDHVTRNKQRELEEKDHFAKSLQETITKLNEQATSRDILTEALQENIKELTQQLKSKDLILQTIPDQIPSLSSSHQDQDQPSTSSSIPSKSSTSQERNTKVVIEEVLQRLKDDREKVKKESSMKQERATKLLRHFPGRETSNWINYELRKFNVEYGVYLKALNDRISMIESIDGFAPLPPAPGFSEKFLNMYHDIVKKESELKAKNYTRMKAAPSSRAPEELEDQECLICLGEMEDHDRTLKCASCSRRYHNDCLEDWLQKKRLCPACDVGMLRDDEFPMP